MTDEIRNTMPIVQCHKRVRAAEIVMVDGRKLMLSGVRPIAVEQEFIDKHNPKSGDYLVEYEDGYRSVSPAKAFAEGYWLLEDQDEAELEFGDNEPDTDGAPEPDKPFLGQKHEDKSSGLTFDKIGGA